MADMKTKPHARPARAIKVRRNPDYPDSYVVEVRCPYGCKRPHTHGLPGDFQPGESTEHRVAHCHDPKVRARTEYRAGYYLEVQENDMP